MLNFDLIQLGLDNNQLNLDNGLATRAMIVKKAERVDVECIVRGYITGSAW